MPGINAVISDADGTLVDTVSLIRHGQYEAAAAFLRQHQIPQDEVPSYETYERLLNSVVGGSARQTLERTVKVLYEDRVHHLEGMDYDELHNLLNPVQDRLAPDYVKGFPGLSETLTQIGGMGIKLAVFSSGTPHHIVRNFGIALRDHVGESYASMYLDKSVDDHTKLRAFAERLQEVFRIPLISLVTCEDVGEHTKPDPFSVLIALERLGVQPQNALILGDHSYDMQAGVKAGIDLRVGITHGFDDADELRSAGATDIIHKLPSLTHLL